MGAKSSYHIPVLFEPTIDALNIKPDGIYVDGTAGGGGHASAIASKLTSGRLFALDQDPDAIKAAGERLAGLPATLITTNFRDMKAVLAEQGVFEVDGILLDLGVSSHQLDDAARGFSYHADAPLDMRMSQSGKTAADLLNESSGGDLVRIFRDYGEEKFAKPIVAAIVREREKDPVWTTSRLAELIAAAVPAAARRDKHPARRVFQALRIAVNGELELLPGALEDAFSLLKPGGRLAVITFHSLEDRIVKEQFARFCVGCVCPKEFPVCVCERTSPGKLALRKPVTATEQELADNPRSRSAKLRCIEKIHSLYE